MIVQYCGKSSSSVVLQIAAAKIVPVSSLVVLLLFACYVACEMRRWDVISDKIGAYVIASL